MKKSNLLAVLTVLTMFAGNVLASDVPVRMKTKAARDVQSVRDVKAAANAKAARDAQSARDAKAAAASASAAVDVNTTANH